MSDRVFVADIGTSKVAVVSAVLNEQDHIKIDGVAVAPCGGVSKGEITNRESVLEAVQDCLDRVQADVRQRAKSMTFSVGGQQVQSMRSQGFCPILPAGRPIKRQDVHHVINHSRHILMPVGVEQLMAIPTEFRVDKQRNLQRVVGLPGSRLEVLTHVITISSAAVHNVEIIARGVGVEVEAIVPEPLASALGVASQEVVDSGCIVIDIGATVTSIAAFQAGMHTFCATLPIGGRHVTSDISQLLHTDLREAERIKVSNGHALAASVSDKETLTITKEDGNTRQLPKKIVAEIVESRIRELFGYIKEEINKAGLSQGAIQSVQLTGGGSLLTGIEGLAHEALDIRHCRVVQPKASGGHSREIGTPRMATVVGLARFALEEEEDAFEPASGQTGWHRAYHTLKSAFGSKS